MKMLKGTIEEIGLVTHLAEVILDETSSEIVTPPHCILINLSAGI